MLAERKNKVRLVGSAHTANRNWAQDTAAPGQRLLASMGWQAGQGLGNGSSEANTTAQNAISASIKLDNKGIGSQRAERDARASGAMDPWSNQGSRDFGALLERLNATAAASPAAQLPPSPSHQAAKRSRESLDPEHDDPKTQHDGKDDQRSSKRRRKQEKAQRKAATAEKKSTIKADRKSSGNSSDTSPATPPSATAKAQPSRAQPPPPPPASKPPAIPPHLAHRTRYLRAKSQARSSDLGALNEILGISPASTRSATPVSPAPPKLAPGPGGSQVPIIQDRLAGPATAPVSLAGTQPTSDADSSSEEESQVKDTKSTKNKKDKKDKKTKGKSDKKQDKKDKKERRAAKKAAKAVAAAGQSGSQGTPPTSDGPSKALDPSLDPSKSNLRVSNVSVHEYLQNRLWIRKAAVQRAQAERGNVWGRLASTATATAH